MPYAEGAARQIASQQRQERFGLRTRVGNAETNKRRCDEIWLPVLSQSPEDGHSLAPVQQQAPDLALANRDGRHGGEWLQTVTTAGLFTA